MPTTDVILRAASQGAVTADNVELGFARVREITGSALDDTAMAAAIAACLRDKLIREPVRLPEGALQCHWTLELTQAGIAATRAASGAG